MKYPTSAKIADKAARVSEVISTLCIMVDDIYRMVDEIAPDDFPVWITDMSKLDEARSLVYDAIDTLDEQLYSYTYDAEEAAKEIEETSEEDDNDNACLRALYRGELSALASDYNHQNF
jgi:hypothetical protein